MRSRSSIESATITVSRATAFRRTVAVGSSTKAGELAHVDIPNPKAGKHHCGEATA